MTTISKKMCMLGDFGVGKTSLIRRFVERQFSDKYLSTVGVKISRKTVELQNINNQEKQDLKLLIWDIEGQTKFKAISPSYIQGASGVLIVADVTRQETIQHLENHIQLYLSVNPKGVIAIALNKSDLVDKEAIGQLIDLIQFEEEQVIEIYQTSAKTGLNVDDIFETLSTRILLKS